MGASKLFHQQHIDLDGAGFVVNPAFHKAQRKANDATKRTVWPPGGADDGAAPMWHGGAGGTDDTVGASIWPGGDATYEEPQDAAARGPSADHIYQLAGSDTSKEAQKKKKKAGGHKGGEQQVAVGPPRSKTGRVAAMPDAPPAGSSTTTTANSSFVTEQPSVKDKKKNNAATAGSVIYGRFEWFVTFWLWFVPFDVIFGRSDVLSPILARLSIYGTATMHDSHTHRLHRAITLILLHFPRAGTTAQRCRRPRYGVAPHFLVPLPANRPSHPPQKTKQNNNNNNNTPHWPHRSS